MKNFLNKIALFSAFCGVFASANEIPKPVKDAIEFIKSPDRIYYDETLTFGDEKIFTPMHYGLSPQKDKLLDVIKVKIDNNKTYQEKLSKLKQNNEDFCGNFFDDLKEFKNIEIKKPLVKDVPYSDETFRFYMDKCYYMGLDWYSGEYQHWNEYDREFSPESMIKPYSYTLYETNFAGADNLLLIQNFDYYRDNETKYTYSNIVVINTDVCYSVFKSLKDSKDFNMFKHRKIIGEETADFKWGLYDEYYFHHIDSNRNFNILNYKGQDYILSIFNDKNEKIRIKLMDHLEKEAYWSESHKCDRKYY